MSEIKLPRREREKIRHRQAMLNAALELFSEKGYQNVSINEIAAKAEFAIGTIYKFFKSKEDLYQSLIKGAADKFHDELEKSLDQGNDEVDKLHNFVRTKMALFKDNQAVIRLYFAETSGASFSIKSNMDERLKEGYDQILQKIASVFESGIRKERFKQVADPYYLAVALEGMTNAFLFLLLDDSTQVSFPEDDSVIMNILLKGLQN